MKLSLESICICPVPWQGISFSLITNMKQEHTLDLFNYEYLMEYILYFNYSIFEWVLRTRCILLQRASHSDVVVPWEDGYFQEVGFQ